MEIAVYLESTFEDTGHFLTLQRNKYINMPKDRGLLTRVYLNMASHRSEEFSFDNFGIKTCSQTTTLVLMETLRRLPMN